MVRACESCDIRYTELEQITRFVYKTQLSYPVVKMADSCARSGVVLVLNFLTSTGEGMSPNLVMRRDSTLRILQITNYRLFMKSLPVSNTRQLRNAWILVTTWIRLDLCLLTRNSSMKLPVFHGNLFMNLMHA